MCVAYKIYIYVLICTLYIYTYVHRVHSFIFFCVSSFGYLVVARSVLLIAVHTNVVHFVLSFLILFFSFVSPEASLSYNLNVFFIFFFLSLFSTIW